MLLPVRLYKDEDRISKGDCKLCDNIFDTIHSFVRVDGLRSLTFAFHCENGHGGTGNIDTYSVDDQGDYDDQ